MSSTLLVRILANTQGLTKGLDDVDSKLGKFGSSMQRIGGMVTGALATTGLVSFANSAINAASDLNETVSKAGVIFGDSAEDIKKFGKNAAKTMGQSQQQAIDAASTFGVFGKAAGLTGRDLSGFSMNLTSLASDLASFSNTTPQEAIDALGAALRGESEPIRKYGVMLDDAALKAEAMSMGIYSGNQPLTAQQKILAANSVIFKKTSDAQGDFSRTANGAANRTRTLNANFQNLKTTIGEKLLPIKMKLLDIAQRLIDRFNRLSPTMKNVVLITGGVVVAVGVLTTAVGALAVAVNAATWPVLLVIAVVAALVAGFIIAYNKSEEFRKIVDTLATWFRDELVPAIKKAWEWLKDKLMPKLEEFRQWIKDKWTEFEAWWDDYWPRIRRKVVEVWESLKKWWAEYGPLIVNVIKETWDAIVETVSEVVDKLKVFWAEYGDTITKILVSGWMIAYHQVMALWALIQGVIEVALNVLNGRWKEAWNSLTDAISGYVYHQVESVKEYFKGVWALIGPMLSGLLDTVKTAGSRIGSTFVDAFKTSFKSAWNTFAVPANLMIQALPSQIRPNWNIPELAEGGIVTRATLALIGEAGPEAVVPLSKLGSMGSNGAPINVTINTVAGDPVAIERMVVEALTRARRRGTSGIAV